MFDLSYMLNLEEFADLDIEWIKFDFREKDFADLNPDELKMVEEIKRKALVKKWVIIWILLGLATLISWHGLWI